MKPPPITVVRNATMEFTDSRYINFRGVPALVQIGDHVFSSPAPTGAGEAESINRMLRELAAGKSSS